MTVVLNVGVECDEALFAVCHDARTICDRIRRNLHWSVDYVDPYDVKKEVLGELAEFGT